MGLLSNIWTAIKPTKAKLTNVVETLKSAVTGKGVVANTPSPTVNKILSTAASNPFTTAAIAAVGVAPKLAYTALTTAIKAAPTSVKIGGAIAAPVVIGAAVSNPKIIGDAASLPSSLSSFGSNIGAFTADPSLGSAAQIFKDDPLISSAVIGAAAIIGGKTVGTLANTLAMTKNTAATNKAIDAMNTGVLPADLGSGAVLSTASTGSETMPITPETQIVGKSAGSSGVKRYKSKPKSAGSLSQSVKLNIFNQSKIQSVKYLNRRAF